MENLKHTVRWKKTSTSSSKFKEDSLLMEEGMHNHQSPTKDNEDYLPKQGGKYKRIKRIPLFQLNLLSLVVCCFSS